MPRPLTTADAAQRFYARYPYFTCWLDVHFWLAARGMVVREPGSVDEWVKVGRMVRGLRKD